MSAWYSTNIDISLQQNHPLLSAMTWFTRLDGRNKRHADSRFRPFARRRISVRRPFLVRTRLRKPCRRFCTRRLWPDMVGRGPQRICVVVSAGWFEMVDFGTISAPPKSDNIVGAGEKKEGLLGARKVLVWLVSCDASRVGRSAGRWEMDLLNRQGIS